MCFGQSQSYKKSLPWLKIEPERHYVCPNDKKVMNETAHERVSEVTSSSFADDLPK